MFSFEVKRDSVLRDGVHGFFPVLLQMVQSEHNSSPPPQQQQQNKQTNKPKDKTLKSHPPPKKDTHPVKRTHNFNVRTVDISAIQMFIFPDGLSGGDENVQIDPAQLYLYPGVLFLLKRQLINI